MKITSKTKERSCNNSPHAESKHFISKKLMHAMRAYVYLRNRKWRTLLLAPNDECFFCKRPDSLEHAFLECSAANNFFCECLLWFNNEHHTDFNLPSQQLFLKDYNLPPETNPILSRKFDIFVVSSQKYFYSCKMIEKVPKVSELKQKVAIQWRIKKCGTAPAH